MNIEIKIENSMVNIFLREKSKILDELIFAEDHNLAEKLLPSIDRLLRKNKLKPKDIKEMRLKADLGDSFTTYRIAKSVVDSFNWAVKKY